MKLVEQYGVPTVYVDGFGDHQVINGVLHTVGYREHREPGHDAIGLIEVRLIINLTNFFEACQRGLEMAQTGELPPESTTISKHH